MLDEHSFLDRSGAALWRLGPGRAMRLPDKVATRRLRVTEGRLWLTTFGNADEQAADVWLEPGDEMNMADGQQWVAEGWPHASFEILIAPSVQTSSRQRGTAELPWARWLSLLQARRSAA